MSSWGYTRAEMRQEAPLRRVGWRDDDEEFWTVYGLWSLGDMYSDYPTRGEALDIACRLLLRRFVSNWTWARSEHGRTAWVVTVGADRPYYRVVVPYDGEAPSVAATKRQSLSTSVATSRRPR